MSDNRIAYSVREVQQMLGFSDYHTVLNMIETGQLRAVKVGRGRGVWRIPASALDQLLKVPA